MLCVAVIAAIWIEKGMGMVVTGFIPSPLGKITEYVPTGPEILITVGVYAIGFLRSERALQDRGQRPREMEVART